MVNPIVLHNWTKLSKSGQTLVNWQKKSKFTQYEAILDKLAKNNQTLQKVHTIIAVFESHNNGDYHNSYQYETNISSPLSPLSTLW